MQTYLYLQAKYRLQNEDPLAKTYKTFTSLTSHHNPPPPLIQPTYPHPTYAQCVQNQQPPVPELCFSQFLEEFKSMFTQLLQQNTIVLNLLSTVISKVDHQWAASETTGENFHNSNSIEILVVSETQFTIWT